MGYGVKIRQILGFGKYKWGLLLHMVKQYAKEHQPPVHQLPALKRLTMYKHQLQMHRLMQKVTVNILPFKYPSDISLVVSLFGENAVKGMRQFRPNRKHPIKKLRLGLNCNEIVSEFTEEEEEEYYNNVAELTYDRKCTKSGYTFSFDGDNLKIKAQYAMVVAGEGDDRDPDDVTDQYNRMMRYRGGDFCGGNSKG